MSMAGGHRKLFRSRKQDLGATPFVLLTLLLLGLLLLKFTALLEPFTERDQVLLLLPRKI